MTAGLDLLQQLDGYFAHPDVVDITVAQIGCFAFTGQAGDKIDFSKTESQLKKALEASANIFDIEKLETIGLISGREGEDAHLIRCGTYRCRVELPKRLQKFDWDGEAIESFRVITEGSLYCAFATVKETCLVHCAHEFRELLKANWPTTAGIDISTVGPSPIHPTFWFIRVRADSPLLSGQPRVFGSGHTLMILAPQVRDLEGLIKELLFETQLGLYAFYSAQLARLALADETETLRSKFRDLREEVRRLNQISAWHPLKRSRAAVAAQTSIGLLYEVTFDVQQRAIDFSEYRDEALRAVAESEFLANAEGYFREIMSEPLALPDAFLPTLEQFSERIRSQDSGYVTLWSSVVSAIVGGLLGYLAK